MAHYTIGCKIYSDERLLVKTFAGHTCLFLDDGSYVTGINRANNQGNISKYSSQGELLWSTKISPVHDLNLNILKNEVLSISSISEKTPYGPLASDQLHTIDLNSGKILKNVSLNSKKLDLFNRFASVRFRCVDNAIASGGKDLSNQKECYTTHINSFFQISENRLSKKIPWLQKGNFIVTDAFSTRIYIFDENLENILWSKCFLDISLNQIHDAKVSDSGSIHFYINETRQKPSTIALAEYDPIADTSKIIHPKRKPYFLNATIDWFNHLLTFELTVQKKIFLTSPMFGGSQRLSNGILFNTGSKQKGGNSHFIDFEENEQWSFPNETIEHSGLPQAFQVVLKQDLTEFLKNNKM